MLFETSGRGHQGVSKGSFSEKGIRLFSRKNPVCGQVKETGDISLAHKDLVCQEKKNQPTKCIIESLSPLDLRNISKPSPVPAPQQGRNLRSHMTCGWTKKTVIENSKRKKETHGFPFLLLKLFFYDTGAIKALGFQVRGFKIL